jgi:hypothetical protein
VQQLAARVMTAVQHAVVEEHGRLLVGRHVDQLVICTLYAMAKLTQCILPGQYTPRMQEQQQQQHQQQASNKGLAVSFCSIIEAYTKSRITEQQLRQQQHQQQHETGLASGVPPGVLYNVDLGNGTWGDIIGFYNKVYIPTMKNFYVPLWPKEVQQQQQQQQQQQASTSSHSNTNSSSSISSSSISSSTTTTSSGGGVISPGANTSTLPTVHTTEALCPITKQLLMRTPTKKPPMRSPTRRKAPSMQMSTKQHVTKTPTKHHVLQTPIKRQREPCTPSTPPSLLLQTPDASTLQHNGGTITRVLSNAREATPIHTPLKQGERGSAPLTPLALTPLPSSMATGAHKVLGLGGSSSGLGRHGGGALLINGLAMLPQDGDELDVDTQLEDLQYLQDELMGADSS